jgi:hypothetical protein
MAPRTLRRRVRGGLLVWLERWIPGMQRDQRMVSAFPIPGGQSVRVSPEHFENDLKEELTL